MPSGKQPDTIRIRSYCAADYDACRALWIELVAYHKDLYRLATLKDEDMGTGFDDYLKDPVRKGTWVAELDGKIVGFTGLLLNSDVYSEVEPIIVSEQYRSRGIGHLLIDCVVKEAKELNSVLLTIKPGARNIESVAKFARLGFDRVGSIELIRELKTSHHVKSLPGIKIKNTRLKY